MANKKIMLSISGMTCGSCEETIIKAVKHLDGVQEVFASFPKKKAEVLFDPESVSESDIKNAVEKEGYHVLSIGSKRKQPVGRVLPILLIVIALYFIAKYAIGFNSVDLIPKGGGTAGEYAVATLKGEIQTVEATLEPSKYPAIIVQKGIPVEFNLKADGKSINGCNETVELPKYDIEKKLSSGDNIIKFIPAETGSITYTCWMGMIHGQISVVDNLSDITAVQSDLSDPSQQLSGGSCSVGNQTVTEGNIGVAEIKDGQQIMTVKVNDQGYSPAVLVVQKGVKTKIKFEPESLSNCTGSIVFSELGGWLDLSKNELETSFITPEKDFTFANTINMLRGYIKVVDDINDINILAIVKDVNEYKPLTGGCCSLQR